MPVPRMVFVAGPSGGGKSSLFSIHDFEGVTPFSADDYCAELNGQRLGQGRPVYTGIPREIREQSRTALRKFIENSIAARQSFAFETTLRELTFEQARRAKANGFRVEMLFVAAGSVEEHIRRVTIRAHAGGHSASESTLREIYARGMRLLVTAFGENEKGMIDTLAIFDNPRANVQPRPALIVEMVNGQPTAISTAAPEWFRFAVQGTPFELIRLRHRTSSQP